MRVLGVLAASALVLTACSGTDEAPGGAGGDVAEASAEPVTVELVDSGFGQLGDYVHGVVVVTTGDAAAVGEFVTASMNFHDAAGEIVGTSEQVESFSWPGQELVLPMMLDLSATPGVQVAEVDVSVSLSDYGLGGETVDPLEPVEARELRPGEFGGTTAVFEIANPTAADIDGARVGMVCRDAGGTVIGGTSEYPNLIAAGKTVLVESDVATSGEPDTCTAYPNYGF